VEAGITDHAQEQLGDLVFVELPEVGRTVAAGEAYAVVESVKAASDVYSPGTGQVIEVNTSLATHPELINQEPLGAGWMVRLRTTDEAFEGRLLTESDYEKLVHSEEA